jgi:Tfp pilus assembly protein PilX
MSAMRHIRCRLAAEAGIALPIAIIVLLILTTLTAAAVTVAVQTSTSTKRDDNVKAALQAAETGLRVATYRTNMLNPEEVKCVNAGNVVEPSEGYCKDETESLGNQASFTYATTPALKEGNTCAGQTVVNKVGVVQRCVTATGTVNGVARRVEARVAAFTASPLFPVNGLFGLNSVTVVNNANVKAKGGTNGTFTIDNNAHVEGVTLGHGGKVTVGNNGSSGTVTEEPTQFTLSPVQTGNSAETAVGGNCGVSAEKGKNCDGRITNGLQEPTVTPFDQSNKATFNAATRELSIGINGSLTLGGGIYNFCNFETSNNSTITLATGVSTAIYIDTPGDPNSKCPAGSGKFKMSNNSGFVNPSKDPTALQIYVFDGSGGPVEFSNNTTFYGTIYAPSSTVYVQNNAEFVGAVASKVVELKNNVPFNADSRVEEEKATTVGIYYRTAWEECASSSLSSPQAGC